MKIRLEDIEQVVDQALYLKAEELLDTDALQGLDEIENNLWTAWIQTVDLQFEVEIQIKGANAINATCDCQRDAKTVACAHIIAVLLGIRNQKAKIKPKSETPKLFEPEPIEKWLPTSFIEELPEEALYEFVKLYAKQDKRFMLALKVHFATQVDSLKDQAAYLNILETAQKSTRRSGKKFSHQSQRDYLKVVDKLLAQAKDSYQQQDWKATFDLTFSLLQNLLHNLPFTDKAKRPYLDRCRSVFVYARDLAALPLAPELEASFLDFFLQQIQLNGIAFKYLGEELIECARLKSTSQSNQLELFQMLEEIRSEADAYHPYWTVLCSTLLDLASHQDIKQLGKIVAIDKISAEIFSHCLEHLETQFAYEALKTLTAFARTVFKHSEFLAELNEYDLRIAIRANETEMIIHFAELRLFESGKLSYYQILKKTTDAQNWKTNRAALLDKLNAEEQTLKIQELIGEILRFEKQPKKLLNYASEQLAMAVMCEHAQWLFDCLPDELQKKYPALILNYTDQHVGPVAAKQVKLALREIQSIFGDDICNNLIVELKTRHPQRQTLLGSLETLNA